MRDLQLIGELSSTLGASSLKNFSTVSGRHSLSETMFLFSLSLLRLIGSLHDSHLLLKILTSRAESAPLTAYSYESRVYYITKGSICQDVFSNFI